MSLGPIANERIERLMAILPTLTFEVQVTVIAALCGVNVEAITHPLIQAWCALNAPRVAQWSKDKSHG